MRKHSARSATMEIMVIEIRSCSAISAGSAFIRSASVSHLYRQKNGSVSSAKLLGLTSAGPSCVRSAGNEEERSDLPAYCKKTRI